MISLNVVAFNHCIIPGTANGLYQLQLQLLGLGHDCKAKHRHAVKLNCEKIVGEISVGELAVGELTVGETSCRRNGMSAKSN